MIQTGKRKSSAMVISPCLKEQSMECVILSENYENPLLSVSVDHSQLSQGVFAR